MRNRIKVNVLYQTWRLQRKMQNPYTPNDNNCWCISILVQQIPHLAAKPEDRWTPTQGSSSSNSATNARSYLSQYMTDLQLLVQGTGCRVLATEACCQPPVCCCPTNGTECYFCSSITDFRWKIFSVCGLQTKGARNRMEKSLYMRAWLKVNFDELNDML